MSLEELLTALAADPMERLRWLVLRRFGVLPFSEQARGLSDEDFVMCGAHMVLDARGSSRGGYDEGGVNASFDEDRFKNLGGVEHE